MQDGVICKIPCECGKVCIGATVIKSSQEKQNLVFSPACTQTSGISVHAHKFDLHPLWNKAKFIDEDPHWYTIWIQSKVEPILLSVAGSFFGGGGGSTTCICAWLQHFLLFLFLFYDTQLKNALTSQLVESKLSKCGYP